MSTKVVRGNLDWGYDFDAVSPRSKVADLSGSSGEPRVMKRVVKGYYEFTEKIGLRPVGSVILTTAVVDDSIPNSDECTRLDFAVHREAILLGNILRRRLGLTEYERLLHYDASALTGESVNPNVDGARCPVAIQFYIPRKEEEL